MSWSAQQETALKTVSGWARARQSDQQVFRLFGYAGTGKTTLAQEVANRVKGKVVYAAFTGKAALVMQSKGCHGASTIHSLIYKPIEEGQGEPKFELNLNSPITQAKLCIIDECSMVDEVLGKDLLSFGVKILVIGDPEQLPPVRGAGFFTVGEPDVMLTEVHRQARDNPIIRISMDVREGRKLAVGTSEGCSVISQRGIGRNELRSIVLGSDQILVGLNRTRRLYNDRVRELSGKSGGPQLEDRLVCLRNNRLKGLLNGGIWTVDEIVDEDEISYDMVLVPDDAGTTVRRAPVRAHKYFFLGRENELEWEDRRDFDEFDFGYALTVHKSQGSQWDSVTLFDESGSFREDRRRWLYTGITRAAKQLTVVVQ